MLVIRLDYLHTALFIYADWPIKYDEQFDNFRPPYKGRFNNVVMPCLTLLCNSQSDYNFECSIFVYFVPDLFFVISIFLTKINSQKDRLYKFVYL